MNLEIRDLYSLDPEAGLEDGPLDKVDFDLFVEVSIGEVGQPGSELFGLRVCSASALAATESGRFLSHVLVLDRFEWSVVKARIEKVLRHTSSCSDWRSVIENLAPFLFYRD